MIDDEIKKAAIHFAKRELKDEFNPKRYVEWCAFYLFQYLENNGYKVVKDA